MNPSLSQILSEIKDSDIHKARNATVRATLVLERDVRGYWDREMIEGSPQPGLYDQIFTDEDMAAFIKELAIFSQDSSLAQELRESTISALCVSNRLEVFSFFVELLKRSENFKSLCETTDILYRIAFIRDEKEFYLQRTDDLREIITKLKGMDFTDDTAKIAKQHLFAKLGEQS